MANIVPLNVATHRELRVQHRASATLGDNQRFVPVVVNEFALLAAHYPVLLSKDSETGTFYCGAMLGFDAGENLFLDGDRAEDAYRPLNLQRGPFYTAGSELAVDLASPRIGGEGGQTLFTDAGEPTGYLANIIAVMRELRPGQERTKVFVENLVANKLIAPVAINVAFDDGTRREVDGLYTIDQEALRALPDATVLEFFHRGYLHLIYVMISSVKQVGVLAQRKNRRILRETEALGGPPR
jgi:hypothetical protein